MNKHWSKMAVTLLVTAGGALAFALPALAGTTISGNITCAAEAPMGVWVTANSGGSGWASWSRSTDNMIHYSKYLPNGGSWYLAVGCGGSKASWGKTTYSNTYSGGGNFSFTCWDIRNAYYAYLRCQKT
jgi:hypothetical protein